MTDNIELHVDRFIGQLVTIFDEIASLPFLKYELGVFFFFLFVNFIKIKNFYLPTDTTVRLLIRVGAD